MADIDLGFPEERESAWLTNRYFPSKVGGKPAWLELDDLPSREVFICENCNNPKTFLCQIYAPFGDDHNFHRIIYVFICRSETCQQANSARNLMVLRSQLPRENKFYSSEPPAENGEPEPPVAAGKHLCLACGNLGPFACGRCKNVNYCSTQHQRAHWPFHKKECTGGGSRQETGSVTELLFPEWEIAIESNAQANDADKADGADVEPSEQSRIDQYEKLVAEGKAGVLEGVPDSELEQYAEGCAAVDDKVFRKFKKEIKKNPDQIVRYKLGGEPLWIADPSRTIAALLDIPKCEYCGSARQFEFQIMPQMLLLLKDERLDWGVLAVYTCGSSCKPPAGVGYLSEYIIKQDIVVNTNTQ